MVLVPRGRPDADVQRRTRQRGARRHCRLHRPACVDEAGRRFRARAYARRQTARGRDETHRCAHRRRIRLAPSRRWPAIEQPRPGEILARSDRQRATIPSVARKECPRRAGQDLLRGPACFVEQVAEGDRRPALHVRSDRSPQRPLWFPRSCGGAPSCWAARRWNGAVGDHEEPSRDSQMASRCGPVESEAVSQSSDCIPVEQMKGRTDKTGQFVLAVENPLTPRSFRRAWPKGGATS